MTTYDQRARAQAARQLSPISKGGKGQIIKITTPFVGALDPATDTVTTGSPTVRTGSGIVVEYTTFLRSGLRNEHGSLIKGGDKQLLLSPLDLTGAPLAPRPQVDDKVTLMVDDGSGGLTDGDSFTITSLAPLSPAGLDIMFDCNIRGST